MTSRRSVLASGCAAMLAGGCQVYGETAPAPPLSGLGGPALAQLADIPVGGGKVFPEQKVVVTQPTAGVVKAFSAVCTHQGCLVTGVEDGNIVCPCHGSAFKLADGSVAAGPAKQALPGVTVTVSGGAIKLG
jgi:nitrite reductase/ring-hydroxylating ferredoxin subunit